MAPRRIVTDAAVTLALRAHGGVVRRAAVWRLVAARPRAAMVVCTACLLPAVEPTARLTRVLIERV